MVAQSGPAYAPRMRINWTLCLLASIVVASAPAQAIRQSETELINSILTATLAKNHQLEVVSSGDVQRMVELESEKQALGCSSSTCLAEIAGALGAELVIYGDVGDLGSQVVLTLNLFDSNSGTAPGREVVVAPSIDDLTGRLTDTANALVADIIKARPGTKMRVVVLGLQLRGGGAGAASTVPAPAASAGPAASPDDGGGIPTPALAGFGVGGALVAVGAGALVGAYIIDAGADDPAVSAKEAAAAYGNRDVAGAVGLTALAVGVVGVAVGTVFLVMGE